jgi:hypothetical protein
MEHATANCIPVPQKADELESHDGEQVMQTDTGCASANFQYASKSYSSRFNLLQRSSVRGPHLRLPRPDAAVSGSFVESLSFLADDNTFIRSYASRVEELLALLSGADHLAVGEAS